MRLVYVCRCCGKELTDADVARLKEGDYLTVTEPEAQQLREVMRTSKPTGRAWLEGRTVNEDALVAKVRQWRW